MSDFQLTAATWEQHQSLVMSELQRHSEVLGRLESKLDTRLERHDERLTDLQSEQAAIKANVGLWAALVGTLSGAIPVTIALVLKWLTPHR